MIAAAATLVVLDKGLTKEALQLKISGLTSPQSFEVVRHFSPFDSGLKI